LEIDGMKILIGGSPCTYWSIAQTKNRETKASGVGWELFLNYRIARDKYQPDYFLYENNKSMSPAIRAQITAELGVEPVLINSALVSAQNRQRLYWVGRRNPDGTYNQVPVEQPVDRGILLRDILETGAVTWKEKAYTLRASAGTKQGVSNILRHIETNGKFGYMGVAEPVRMRDILETSTGKKGYALDPTHAEVLNMNPSGYGMNGAVIHCDGKSRTLTTNKGEGPKIITPIRIATIENDAKNPDHDSQQYRCYSPDAKSVTLCGNGGGPDAKTGLYAVPVAGRVVGRRINEQGHRDDYNEAIPHFQYFEVNEEPQKTNCLTTVQKDNMIAAPVIPDGKGQFAIKAAGGKEIPVYEVRGGRITIKEKTYPIKLADGFYIIRKLIVTECKRLQTVPDTYAFPVSDTQAYKMLGNGWTVDVIAHIMSHFTGLTEEPVEVLSMYDGMSCGHIALDKLGANVTAYYATEIDKYAIQTTQHNYPEMVQLGDAFQVRKEDWTL
jgi:DNA (cytosine-5)-methyltransferase 3A